MNRNWMKFILLCVISLGMMACQQEGVPGIVNDNLTLRIRVSPSEENSRAENSGDVWNENKLTKVDCFFYPAGGGTQEPVYIIPAYSLDQSTTGTISVMLDDEEMERLFPNGATTCVVYMIANRPDDVELPEEKKIASLKSMVIEAEFSGSGEERVQSDFVMDGQSNSISLITESTGKKKVTGNVDLYRAASKVELVVTEVTDQITEGGVVWRSDPSRMYIRMFNGVNRSKVDASQQVYDISSGDYYHTEYEPLVPIGESGSYSSHVPYYSYSSDWTSDDEHEVYFTLVLPWGKVETDAEGNENVSMYRTCYYQIPVNFDEKKLSRNTYYRLNLKVGVLGSFVDPDEPDDPEAPEIPTEVTLLPSYIIVPWSENIIEMNAQLQRPTYLVVDKNYAEMHNVSEISIGFASSHATSVRLDKVEYYNYQLAATRKVTITADDKTISSGDEPNDGIKYATFNVSINEATHLLTLKNNTNPASFYTIQDIYMTITNAAGLSEQIKVKWYPPIYFEAKKSEAYVFSNGYSYSNPNGDKQSNWDAYYIKNDGSTVFGSITNPTYLRQQSSNNNENQYNIYITSLPSGSNLQIGDPRETLGGPMAGLNELTNYRPTRRDAVNVVAPIFKIASSFGMTSQHTYELSQQRCASYQENGYPAGRWRMPTSGEFEFIKARSANGDIPSLFADTYWTANGRNNDIGNFGGQAMSVRCVYDVWYWGDGQVPDITKPYWGDNGLKTHAEAQP